MRIVCILSIILLFGCKNNNQQINSKSLDKNDSIVSMSIQAVSQLKYIDPTGTYILDIKTEQKEGDIYGYSGEIQIEKIDLNELAITFSINKGAPSYNMGGFIDTLKYIDNKTIYKGDNDNSNCFIELSFSENGIEVDQGEDTDCGFGHGVHANGFFKKVSSLVPILNNPFTGKRITRNHYINEAKIISEVDNIEEMPEVFNQLFNVKLVGLDLQKNGQDRKYTKTFEMVCMCEGQSILINKNEKKLFIYPYCSDQPKKGEYNNWEISIKSSHYIDNKLVIYCDSECLSDPLVFVFGIVEENNVFSLEIEGEKPNSMWLNNYITPNPDLFEGGDCGDFDG